MNGEHSTTTTELGRCARVVIAVVLVVSAFAPAVAGVVSASSSTSTTAAPATSGDTYPDAGVPESRFASQENGSTNGSDGAGWTWPWDDARNSTNETEPTGPPETEFNATKLRQTGEQVSSRPSVRQFGPGTIWLRHVPTGPLAVDDPGNYSRYVSPYSVVTRDHVYLGGFLGWDAPNVDATVHVVTWSPERVTYTQEVDNRTVTRTKTVPGNVTHDRTEVTLGGGEFFRHEIGLPKRYGETRHVTIWIESPQIDNARWSTQWAFRSNINPATQSVPQESLAARIQWGAFVIGGSTMVTALLVLYLGKKILDKIGAVIIHPAELFFAVFAPTVPIVLLFWNSIIAATAQRPQLIGVGLGAFIGLVGIWIIREKPEEWLLLQPTTDAEMDEQGRGSWHWANRAHYVIERGRDGRLAVPREGWLAAIARVWPLYDATPLLEFDAHSIEDHKVDSVPDDVDLPDDASALDRLKTRLVGDGEQDEYDEILPVHPASEHVVDHTGETLSIGLPTLWEWPDEDSDSGVWIGSVPIPSIRFGLIFAAIAFVTVTASLVTWVTTSILWGLIAACAAVLALVIHPNEDSKAEIDLAPAPFDAVIANMISTFEGFNDMADANYWQDRALEAEAILRMERADERESNEMTKLRQLGQRLAPERETTDRDARRENQNARERYGVGEGADPDERKGEVSPGE